jgi:hypothetical protein
MLLRNLAAFCFWICEASPGAAMPPWDCGCQHVRVIMIYIPRFRRGYITTPSWLGAESVKRIHPTVSYRRSSYTCRQGGVCIYGEELKVETGTASVVMHCGGLRTPCQATVDNRRPSCLKRMYQSGRSIWAPQKLYSLLARHVHSLPQSRFNQQRHSDIFQHLFGTGGMPGMHLKLDEELMSSFYQT